MITRILARFRPLTLPNLCAIGLLAIAAWAVLILVLALLIQLPRIAL